MALIINDKSFTSRVLVLLGKVTLRKDVILNIDAERALCHANRKREERHASHDALYRFEIDIFRS